MELHSPRGNRLPQFLNPNLSFSPSGVGTAKSKRRYRCAPCARLPSTAAGNAHCNPSIPSPGLGRLAIVTPQRLTGLPHGGVSHLLREIHTVIHHPPPPPTAAGNTCAIHQPQTLLPKSVLRIPKPVPPTAVGNAHYTGPTETLMFPDL